MINFFRAENIYKSTISIYNLFKLSLLFSFYTLPWLILNTILLFNAETKFVYFLVGSLLIPNLMAGFKIIHCLKADEDYSLSFKNYWLILKERWVQKTLLSLLISLIFFTLFTELMICLLNVQLLFLVPIFAIALICSIGSLFSFFTLNLVASYDKQSWKRKIKIALFFGWRNPLISLLETLLLIIWVLASYFAPYLVVLLGSGLLFLIGYQSNFHIIRKIAQL